MNSIPMVDLRPMHRLMSDDIATAMANVLEQMDFVNGIAGFDA
jgi:hypothetical protein